MAWATSGDGHILTKMSEPKKKLSLNVVPDPRKVEQFMQRAEANQPTDGEENVDNDHPGAAVPPADWPAERKLLHGQIVAAMKTVYDPEIPVDIYELGLIYNIDITPENVVNIRMTLTAPACPVAGQLMEQVEQRAENVEQVKEARVELVFDPPWSPARMSEAARMQLGMM